MKEIVVVIAKITVTVHKDHPRLERIVKFVEVVTHKDIDLENQLKYGSPEGEVYIFHLTNEQFEQWKSWIVFEDINWKYGDY